MALASVVNALAAAGSFPKVYARARGMERPVSHINCRRKPRPSRDISKPRKKGENRRNPPLLRLALMLGTLLPMQMTSAKTRRTQVPSMKKFRPLRRFQLRKFGARLIGRRSDGN